MSFKLHKGLKRKWIKQSLRKAWRHQKEVFRSLSKVVSIIKYKKTSLRRQAKSDESKNNVQGDYNK